MALNIGIDFGTSTIYVTRWNEKKQCAEHIPNITRDSSEKFIENIVYYESENNLILGQKAKRKGMSFPENMVLNVKRQIEHSQWTTPIKSLNRHLNASEITTDIFKFLKNRIEELHGGTEIESVVITVPFSFKEKERALIQNSAEQAGLSSIQLIEEPVSAGISYGFFHDETFATEQPQHILMFDLGGGTLDIAILKISKSEQHEFLIDILNTGGDKHLGGKDIDQIIFNELLKTLCVHSQSLSLIDYHDLFIEAKRIKENLSEMEEDEALLNLRDLKQTLEQTITVELFNQWLKNYGFIDKIIATLQQTLNEIQFKPNQIDKILLVGGSSNIPLIQSEIEKFFNKNTEILKDPSEMVGEGAGIYCGMLASHKLKYKITDKSQSLKNNEVNHQDNALLLEILKRMDHFDQKIEKLENKPQNQNDVSLIKNILLNFNQHVLEPQIKNISASISTDGDLYKKINHLSSVINTNFQTVNDKFNEYNKFSYKLNNNIYEKIKDVDFAIKGEYSQTLNDINTNLKNIPNLTTFNTNLSTLNSTLKQSASAIELEKTQGLINRDVITPIKQLKEFNHQINTLLHQQNALALTQFDVLKQHIDVLLNQSTQKVTEDITNLLIKLVDKIAFFLETSNNVDSNIFTEIEKINKELNIFQTNMKHINSGIYYLINNKK